MLYNFLSKFTCFIVSKASELSLCKRGICINTHTYVTETVVSQFLEDTKIKVWFKLVRK